MALGDGIRRNIAYVDPTERALLRKAILDLNAKMYPGERTDTPAPGGVTWWFKQDEIHHATHVHGRPEFLPWHRVLVNRFEGLLREIDPRLSLHYWDWTQDPRKIPDANLGENRVVEPWATGTGHGGPVRPWAAPENRADKTRYRDRAVLTPPRYDTRVVTLDDFQVVRPEFADPNPKRHVRALADLGDDGHDDIVFFGDKGVMVSKRTAAKAFKTPSTVIYNYNYDGGWRVDEHLRFAADVTGDGKADIVGFGADSVWVSLNTGTTFTTPMPAIPDFTFNKGWLVDRHPRFLAPITHSKRPDVVGFGSAGVIVSLNDGGGKFSDPHLVLESFGFNDGWRVDRHPRMLADLTGDGTADIVAFGDNGVQVALADGKGGFDRSSSALASFGYGKDAGGWRVDRNPRYAVDITGEGRADIVGFGAAGVWVSLNQGNDDGKFSDPFLAVDNFGTDAGWEVGTHPRFLVDLTGDGKADIVGFGTSRVYVALNRGNGTFGRPQPVATKFFTKNGGWSAEHQRFVRAVDRDGAVHVIGFGPDGVATATFTL